jgi:hypothetical protein
MGRGDEKARLDTWGDIKASRRIRLFYSVSIIGDFWVSRLLVGAPCAARRAKAHTAHTALTHIQALSHTARIFVSTLYMYIQIHEYIYIYYRHTTAADTHYI